MKFSVNWLRELVELPTNVDELADLLTFAGIEIEGIEHRGTDIPNVVVAQINSFTQHPNADRLSLCDVDDGTEHHRQIVCGAKNFKAGDKVLVALPGAALPNGLNIKVSKLRGVESQGMLCSPSELHLSDDSNGLLILSADAEVGTPIGKLFSANTILDVEITPNRSDLLSYMGLAREIAALSGKRARLAEITEPATRRDDTVRIDALAECPFYSARRIENVTVGPSPDWLRAKLEAAGLRSINNIVDVTNFVMLELGQPLHAFDADKLQGRINVRLAHPGEKLLALDGKTYALRADSLMIADDARAVAIGGVMGGEDTGVSEGTCNVLLEAAYFLPSSIRRTARTLSLPSDASYRFERGVDPGMVLRASERATELIAQLADGKPAEQISIAGEVPAAPANVTFRYHRCDQLLGVTVPSDELNAGLQRLGLVPITKDAESTTWNIPSYRADLKREVDLIEEVVRQFGINKIVGTNRSTFMPVSAADRGADLDTKIRQKLASKGLFEVRTSNLIPRLYQDFFPGIIAVRNPLNELHWYLRPRLLIGLLRVLELSLRRGENSFRAFEVGRVFLPGTDLRALGMIEQKHLGILMSGSFESTKTWRSKSDRGIDFFDLKAAIETLGLRDLVFERLPIDDAAANGDYSMAARIISGRNEIGHCGQLIMDWQQDANAKSPVFFAEIHYSIAFSDEAVRFHALETQPAVTRDIAMIIPEALSHREVEAAIRGVNEPMLAGVQLFDLFSGKDAASIGSGRKSMAYTLTYRAADRTLTNDEVTVVHTQIRERLKSELRAELRE